MENALKLDDTTFMGRQLKVICSVQGIFQIMTFDIFCFVGTAKEAVF